MSHEQTTRALLGQKKPGEALLALAVALDQLVAAPAADDWSLGAPAPVRDPGSDPRGEWTPALGKANYDAALEQLGPDPGGEDSASWSARRHLLQDLLKEPTPDIGHLVGQTIKPTVNGDEITIDIPPPTPQQFGMRQQLIEQLHLDQENWHKPEIPPCAEQFLKGGPMWMYLAHRDYCESLPSQVIQRFVADVHITSPEDAKNMGIDLLKASDDPSHAVAAADNFDGWMDSHKP